MLRPLSELRVLKVHFDLPELPQTAYTVPVCLIPRATTPEIQHKSVNPLEERTAILAQYCTTSLEEVWVCSAKSWKPWWSIYDIIRASRAGVVCIRWCRWVNRTGFLYV